MENKKNVVILRNEILPLSETFILEQMKFLEKFNPILVGVHRVKNGLDMDNVDFKLFSDLSSNIFQRIDTRIRNMLCVTNPKIARCIKSLNPAIIHIHFGVDAVFFWKDIKSLHVPIIITLHGYDINIHREWWESGKGGRQMQQYPKKLLEIAQCKNVSFIAVSKAIKERAIEFGIPEHKIFLHYIGVDTNKFKSGGIPIVNRDNIVLFVGRFVEKKAPLDLIRAFVEVVKKVPDAKLVMIGDGVLKGEAELLARQLKLPIDFLGALHHNEVLKEFEKAKVFCLPSVAAKNGDAEGLPISVLEAIAKDLFVVVTNHSGNRDIPNIDKIGRMVKERDVQELSNAIIFLLNKSFKKPISEILDFYEFFDLKTCCNKLEVIYERVIND